MAVCTTTASSAVLEFVVKPAPYGVGKFYIADFKCEGVKDMTEFKLSDDLTVTFEMTNVVPLSELE